MRKQSDTIKTIQHVLWCAVALFGWAWIMVDYWYQPQIDALQEALTRAELQLRVLQDRVGAVQYHQMVTARECGATDAAEVTLAAAAEGARHVN